MNKVKDLVILMIGAPGVGKGTYSKMLCKDFNLAYLSSGDELRKLVKNKGKSDISNVDVKKINEIEKIMEKGELVDDEFMKEFITNILSKDNFKNGVILDGYPRRVSQAHDVEAFKKINLVVKLNLNEKVLIKKMLGRRVCTDVNCGKGYNVCAIKENGYDMEPLLPKKDINKCDECGSALEVRKDDTLEIIKDRLNVYNSLTVPLEQYYKDKNLVMEVELKKGIKDYILLKNLVQKQLEYSKLI